MYGYRAEDEQLMQRFYDSLSEKDRRRYAAIEARKLGHGGNGYIASVLGCDPKTIRAGLRELESLPEDTQMAGRIRRPGGGRKPYDQLYPDIESQFLAVLQEHTAGEPMREDVKWTDLTPQDIIDQLADQYQVQVSETVVRKLLKKHDYRRRKAQKKQTMKQVPDRNEQFENIARLKAEYQKAEYQAAGNAIVSMDTKKKEHLGNLYRDGHLYTQETIEVYDHDFTSLADGVVIPHGIYDVQRNTAWLHLGTSHDTSEFACDCLRSWWNNQGRLDYPTSKALLVLCDGGGSNNSRHSIFKQDLQKLTNELGIEIRIAHYPPYTSKYNPIEHRLFPHVTRACQGVVFRSLELVKQLMQKTHTTQGLKVTVKILDNVYQTGRKVSESFRDNMTIVFDEFLPKWNYTAIPKTELIQ